MRVRNDLDGTGHRASETALTKRAAASAVSYSLNPFLPFRNANRVCVSVFYPLRSFLPFQTASQACGLVFLETFRADVGADAHIGPLGTIEFAAGFRVSDVHTAGPMWASAPTQIWKTSEKSAALQNWGCTSFLAVIEPRSPSDFDTEMTGGARQKRPRRVYAEFGDQMGKIIVFTYSVSSSASQSALDASVGIRQSPRGESVTEPTFGPSGMQERLNC